MVNNLNKYNLAIAKGDKAAFKAVFDRLYSPLLKYAQHFIMDEMLAEELVQEGFLLLWEKRTNIDLKFNIKAYLFKTIHNQALNHIRHQKVVKAHQKTEKPIETINQTADPLLGEAIDKALEELSPRVKVIFELSKIQGYRNKEIAQKLSISPKTVEVQLRNAKLILQKLLKPYYKNL